MKKTLIIGIAVMMLVPLITGCGTKEEASVTYDYVYEGESDFEHKSGSQEEDGWSASPSQDGMDHMMYGPYAENIVTGNYDVDFYMMIDEVKGDDDRVVNLDIYNKTSDMVIAELEVFRGDFDKANTYEKITINTDFVLGNVYEFRVYYDAMSYVKIDKVGLHLTE